MDRDALIAALRGALERRKRGVLDAELAERLARARLPERGRAGLT